MKQDTETKIKNNNREKKQMKQETETTKTNKNQEKNTTLDT